MRKPLIVCLIVIALAGVGIYLWVSSREASILDQPTTWTESTDLKTTQIVSSVDTPIKPGQSWIWCATFQLAWDQMCDKVNGSAITLEGAEDESQRLNNSTFDSKNLVKGSY